MESGEPETVDLSRLNREERRRIGERIKQKIVGRNLPYVQKIHGSYENYYKIRGEEIAQENAKAKKES